ncbi:MAG: hypothetical protein ACXV0U_03360 [Kineosporiaceae bacterium]
MTAMSPAFPVGRPRKEAVLPEVRVAAAVVASGLLVGGVWALWAPSVAHSADLGEAQVGVDGVLALLGLGAGVVTAGVLTLVPGPRPAVRLAVVLLACTLANLLAAAVGMARGLHLGAPGVALMWPLAAAFLTTLRTIVAIVVSPGGAPDDGRGAAPDDARGAAPDDVSDDAPDDEAPGRPRRHEGISGPPSP